MQGLLDRFGWTLPAGLALGIPVLFDPQGSDGFILPRTSLLIAGAGIAVVFRLWSHSDGFGTLQVPALAVASAAILAAAFSISVPLSIGGAYERYDDAVVRLSYLGVFAASVWFLPTQAARRRVVSAFLLSCCVIAMEAVWQFHLGLANRPDGNLGQPNLLGVLLAMAIPLAVDRVRFHWRWLLPVPLLAAGLLLSGSRAAWLGAVLGCGGLLLFRVPRSWRPAAAGAAALTVVIVVVLVLTTPLRNLGNDTGAARLHVWQDSVQMVASRPLTGWGEDTFGLVFGRFQRGDWESGQTFDRAHSEPLDLLASQGIAGLLAAVWFWGVFWSRLLRRMQMEEVAAIGAAWLAYASWALLNFDWAPATGPFWLLAGVGWAATREPSPESPQVRQFPALPAAVLTTLLCAAVFARAVLPPVADRLDFNGNHAAAARLDPLQAKYHEETGIAAIDTDDLATAEAELLRASELGEDDAGSYVELGNVEAALGKRDTAMRAYQRAVEIDPYYSKARNQLNQLEG